MVNGWPQTSSSLKHFYCNEVIYNSTCLTGATHCSKEMHIVTFYFADFLQILFARFAWFFLILWSWITLCFIILWLTCFCNMWTFAFSPWWYDHHDMITLWLSSWVFLFSWHQTESETEADVSHSTNKPCVYWIRFLSESWGLFKSTLFPFVLTASYEVVK